MRVGEKNKLKVINESYIGYTLADEINNEVLMPYSICDKKINKGEMVDVFLYLDNKKRMIATTKDPFIVIGKPNFVNVKEVKKDLGVFIDNNVSKDTLISLDDLPYNYDFWPKVGDTVLCKIKLTEKNLIAKLISPEEAKTLFKPSTKLCKLQSVEALVIKNGEKGTNLITKEGHNIFVFYKHRRRDYRVGEEVMATITNDCNNNVYNATLLESKLKVMKTDAQVILEHLQLCKGQMDFTTSSSVSEIERTFKMSKASFKRALGNLYKQRLIEFKEDKTYLVK